MAALRAVRARAAGRVQGVAYRASLQREAVSRSLSGWVRNLADGGVEFCVQGPADAVEELLDWARTGPPYARVDRVDCQEIEFEPGIGGFDVRY